MKWPVVSIGRACLPTAQREPCSEPEAMFRYVDISSVDKDQKAIVQVQEMLGKDAPSRARKEIRMGDVLVSTVRPNLNAVAVVPPELDGEIASTGFCVLRPNPHVAEGRYIFYRAMTQEFIQFMTARMRGANYPAVTDGVVKECPIPLPPPSEQRRIVEILDQAVALRKRRAEADAKAERILPALFYRMFGDPVRNSKGWPTKPMKELATFVGGGTPSRAIPEYFQGSICWATSKDMKGEVLLDTQEHITEEAIRKSATKLVPPGTLLVVVKSKILMRRLPVLLTQVPTCFGQDLKGIMPDRDVPAAYLARHLRLGQEALLRQARGVNTEGLTLEHLSSYSVMSPPNSLMRTYEKLEQLYCIGRDAMAKATQEADTLFKSLLSRAFKGEL